LFCGHTGVAGAVSTEPPRRELKPDDEEAFTYATKMLSEPMILALTLCILIFCVVVLEWEAIWDAIVGLF